MSNLVFNPLSKDYFKAKACVAISMRYNYAGSFRSWRFEYLSFRNWYSSYRAAFSYVLRRLESFILSRKGLLPDFSNHLFYTDILDLFFKEQSQGIYNMVCNSLTPYFQYYSFEMTPAVKVSYVYKLLEVLIKYNLGDIRYDLVSPMFEEKSAIRYVASKYFPNTPFIVIESDFMFKDVMD